MSLVELSLVVAALSTGVYLLVTHPTIHDVARVVAGVAWVLFGLLTLLD
jgi:hypothetical protein